MNKKNYSYLCKELNALFKEVASRDLLIPCLQSVNIIKENSQYYLKSYLFLNSKFFLIKILSNLILNFLKFLIIFISSIISNIFFKQIIKKKKNEIVFLSHGFSKNKNDVYFKHIKKFYKKKNILTIYINQINTFKVLNRRDNYIYGSNLKIMQFICILKLMSENFIYVLFKMFKSDLRKKNYLYLLSNVFSPTSLYNFIIAHETIEILKRSNSKYLFFTFEGFVYEKYLIHLINKDKTMQISTVGYQHTGLSLYNNSVLKLSTKKFIPNYILTISKRDAIRINHELNFKNTINIGKKINDDNFRKKTSNWRLKSGKNIKCLILYEDNFLEINSLLRDLKSLVSKIEFTIRPHPLFEKSLNQIKNLNQLKITSPSKNINIDLLKHNIIIYKSSSLVFEAIKYGLLPLRLRSVYFDENPLNGIIKNNEINDLSFIKNLNKIIKLNPKNKIDNMVEKIYNNLEISSLKKIK